MLNFCWAVYDRLYEKQIIRPFFCQCVRTCIGYSRHWDAGIFKWSNAWCLLFCNITLLKIIKNCEIILINIHYNRCCHIAEKYWPKYWTACSRLNIPIVRNRTLIEYQLPVKPITQLLTAFNTHTSLNPLSDWKIMPLSKSQRGINGYTVWF